MPKTSVTPCATSVSTNASRRRHLLAAGDGLRQFHGLVHRSLRRRVELSRAELLEVFHSAGLRQPIVQNMDCEISFFAITSTGWPTRSTATLRCCAPWLCSSTSLTRQRPVSLQALTEAAALPKPTVYRMLSVLEQAGLIAREPDDRRVVAGPRLARLALDVLMNDSVRAPRHAILQRLAAEVGETVNMTDAGKRRGRLPRPRRKRVAAADDAAAGVARAAALHGQRQAAARGLLPTVRRRRVVAALDLAAPHRQHDRRPAAPRGRARRDPPRGTRHRQRGIPGRRGLRGGAGDRAGRTRRRVASPCMPRSRACRSRAPSRSCRRCAAPRARSARRSTTATPAAASLRSLNPRRLGSAITAYP